MSGDCTNCGARISDHCTSHAIPCCPGRCPDEGAIVQTMQFGSGRQDAREAIYTGRLHSIDVSHGEAFTRQEWVLDVG